MRAASSTPLPSATFRVAGQQSLALRQNPLNNGNKESLSALQGHLTDHISGSEVQNCGTCEPNEVEATTTAWPVPHQQQDAVGLDGGHIQQHRRRRGIKTVGQQRGLDRGQSLRHRLLVQHQPAVGRLVRAVAKYLRQTGLLSSRSGFQTVSGCRDSLSMCAQSRKCTAEPHSCIVPA